jgi:hypothetical protein
VDCFRKKHVKTLPKFLDLKPLKIDYKRSANPLNANAESNDIVFQVMDQDPEAKNAFSKPCPLETTLGEQWHAFYDLRGVKYFYNFETQESMRRPAEELVNPGGQEYDNMIKSSRKEVQLQMAKAKEPRVLPAWAEGKDAKH